MKKALTIAILLAVGSTTLWAQGDTTRINTDRTIVVDSNLSIRVGLLIYSLGEDKNRETLEFCINDSICSEMELPNIEDVKNFNIDSIYWQDNELVLKISYGGGNYLWWAYFCFVIENNEFILHRVGRLYDHRISEKIPLKSVNLMDIQF